MHYSFFDPILPYGRQCWQQILNFQGMLRYNLDAIFRPFLGLLKPFCVVLPNFTNSTPLLCSKIKDLRKSTLSGLKPLQRQQRGKIRWSHTTRFCNSFLFVTGFDFCRTKHCCCPTSVGYICPSRNAKMFFVHARQV